MKPLECIAFLHYKNYYIQIMINNPYRFVGYGEHVFGYNVLYREINIHGKAVQAL